MSQWRARLWCLLAIGHEGPHVLGRAWQRHVPFGSRCQYSELREVEA